MSLLSKSFLPINTAKWWFDVEILQEVLKFIEFGKWENFKLHYSAFWTGQGFVQRTEALKFVFEQI